MRSFHSLKKKKALAAAGLIIVCAGMVLLSGCLLGQKGRAGKDAEEPSVEPGMNLIPESVSESQEESIEGTESAAEPEPILTAEYELIY